MPNPILRAHFASLSAAAALLVTFSALAVPLPERKDPSPTAPAAAQTLLLTQARFVEAGGQITPGPARLNLYHPDGSLEFIDDPDSNVFHMALPWRDGILTLGGTHAMLKHWKRAGDHWEAETLWERSFGGRFDRLRDIAIADLDGDGAPEIALATHDQGVVAIGDEGAQGWTFRELGRAPDTFIHEVEAGDIDGDGRLELYVTPAQRTRASISMPGGIDYYRFDGDGYASARVVRWSGTHAKEILVTDLDGDGKDELYAAKEARIERDSSFKPTILEPATIVRLVPSADGRWSEHHVMTLDGESQCRFLVPGDANNDGRADIVAAGKDTGLWLVEAAGAGIFTRSLIDANSGGFEHVALVSDLDGDGRSEVYAVSETAANRALQRYRWDGTIWERTVIAAIPERHISWSLQPAAL